jgi:formylglycine-generating enzyme required for sulfatase activity
MVCDSDFYDHITNEYTVKSLIERGKREYGGYDSVVLWHAYPRIGLDERNQFDFYREMPQGLPGLKRVTGQFHQAGIKVFIDYNPWDKGTRREPKSDIDLLIGMLKAIDADGIFLDTMKDAPGFRVKLDAVREGIVLEGEIALPLEHIQTHHMSWAQWFTDSYVPGVYRNKWFERHHMQHAIARWNSDKTPQLQTAWMNGSGMLIWENVFGQWLGWCERDKSIYRAMYSIQHYFSALFSGEEWVPLSEESDIKGIFISSWKSEGIQLRTLVNRNDSVAEGLLFKCKADKGLRFFDLIQGEEIVDGIENSYISLRGHIGRKGIGCFLSIAADRIDRDFYDFITLQKKLLQIASEDTSVPVKNILITNTKQVVRQQTVPEGMVPVPSISTNLRIEYNFREAGGYGNIQDHLLLSRQHKLHSACSIERHAEIKTFAIDKTPVTNLQFRDFIQKSGYSPRVRENFLKHWENGKIPYGKEDHPVVFVDLNDARAFADWAGKRLPAEDEWQFAAQGHEARIFPWGNEMEPGRCNQNMNGQTTAVNAFPEGASPFGCLDMCGNTWELTANEYSEGRTRFVMLKGGSCYKSSGSEWYFDGGPQKNSFTAKMLLIWPGLDRCSTVGFRCAVDL